MIDLIDIHCHMLSGVDDGADTPETSERMLELAYRDGIRTICLTPHYHPARQFNGIGIPEAFNRLRTVAAGRFPDLTLLLGEELLYHQEMVSSVAAGKCRSLNETRHLLVEFSPDVEPSYLFSSLLTVRSRGFLPVLAHAERYDCLLKQRSLVRKIAENGFAIQLNSASILGGSGLRVRIFCHRLLREQLVAVVASDAHDMKERKPTLSACYGHVRRLYGSEYAYSLFCGTPSEILGITKPEG